MERSFSKVFDSDRKYNFFYLVYSISKYLFLFQEIPVCHNEACKIGMSATTTISASAHPDNYYHIQNEWAISNEWVKTLLTSMPKK